MPKKENEDEPIQEAISLEERDRRFEHVRKQMQGHNWRQQGGWIYCTSCPFTHGMHIPISKQIAKNDDGDWILTDVIVR